MAVYTWMLNDWLMRHGQLPGPDLRAWHVWLRCPASARMGVCEVGARAKALAEAGHRALSGHSPAPTDFRTLGAMLLQKRHHRGGGSSRGLWRTGTAAVSGRHRCDAVQAGSGGKSHRELK